MMAALLLAVAFPFWKRKRAAWALAQRLPAALLETASFLRSVALVALLFSGIPGLFLVLAPLL